MLVFRADGLDGLLQSRLAEDNYSPLRRRYSQSPSLPFFLLSSAQAFLHHRLPGQLPRPSVDQGRIRLVCVSDTHNNLIPHSAIPDGDVFIHAGDLTESGTVSELSYTLDWMRSLPHTHKIFIAGNHDTALASREERDSLDFTGLTYLCDQTIELTIRGRKLQIFSSPYTPRFGNFAFQYPPDRAAKQWEKIPRETDVLVTHGPPKAHLDHYGLGCNALLEAVWRVRPAVMVCGHIHAGRGVETLDWDNTQKKWEGVIRARKVVGWWEMVTYVFILSFKWIRGRTGQTGSSVLVNCAIVGGSRNQIIRDAVVVDV